MLSRAQEARIRALIWGSSPGTLLTYCLEHLSTAARIPTSHMSDLAVFVRTLHPQVLGRREPPQGSRRCGRSAASAISGGR